MSTPDELEIIKARWTEENRLAMFYIEPYKDVYDEAVKDIHYLLNRLEAAEKAARGIAMMHGHKLKDRENDWK